MQSTLWKRSEGNGLDRATVASDANGRRIAGTAIFARDEGSYDVRYSIIVDDGWNTRIVAAHVQGPGGERRLSLRVGDDGSWTMGGKALSGLTGVRDVDLAFTPAAIAIPIQRLELEVGQSADIEVAYVEFPDRAVIRESRHYERITSDGYRYTVGKASHDLTVLAGGLVSDVPGRWTAIATP